MTDQAKLSKVAKYIVVAKKAVLFYYQHKCFFKLSESKSVKKSNKLFKKLLCYIKNKHTTTTDIN